MKNLSPTEQIKISLREQLSKVFKQMKGKCSEDHWREFESFFWKVRPQLEVNYIEVESDKNKNMVES